MNSPEIPILFNPLLGKGLKNMEFLEIGIILHIFCSNLPKNQELNFLSVGGSNIDHSAVFTLNSFHTHALCLLQELI